MLAVGLAGAGMMGSAAFAQDSNDAIYDNLTVNGSAIITSLELNGVDVAASIKELEEQSGANEKSIGEVRVSVDEVEKSVSETNKTVAENKEAADEAISAVDDRVDATNKTVADNKKAADEAVSAVDVRVDATNKTVADNKEAADEAISAVDDRVDATNKTVADNKKAADEEISAVDDRVNATNKTVADNKKVVEEAISVVGERVDANLSDIEEINTTLTDLGVDETKPGINYFRVNSESEDASAVGKESVAIGPNAKSEGENSLVAGEGASTTEDGVGAIALGQSASAGSAAPGGGGAGAIAVGRKSAASGSRAIALGDEAKAGGSGASALGAGAEASGAGAIALGRSKATGSNSFAGGNGAQASSPDSIALGTRAGVNTPGTAGGDQRSNIAIGKEAAQNVTAKESIGIGLRAGSNVKGDNNTAIGTEAGTGINGEYNIAIGIEANKGAGVISHSTAVGGKANAGKNSVALGYMAESKGTDSVALGNGAISASSGVALGSNANAEESNIALGLNSQALNTDSNNSSYLTGNAADTGVVSVGSTSSGLTRRIVNVADGANGNDAVNVNQLKGVQKSVANLVGGGVLLNADGSYGKITITDINEKVHEFDSVVDALQAAGDGSIESLPPEAAVYNADGTLDVASAELDGQAVSLGQLNAAVSENSVKYFSVNSSDTGDEANHDNDGAEGTDAVAAGVRALAKGNESLSLGYEARSEADISTAIGNNVRAEGVRSTVLGNQSRVYGENGVAIGHDAVSDGDNSLVMGTRARANDKETGAGIDNAIVIGTEAKSTASEDGIAIGRTALAREDRAVAQGFDARSTADDAMAFGTSSRASGISAQASGTKANASGTNAQASGTEANASGLNSMAQGTRTKSYATDGIAMGTGAVAGFSDPNNQDPERNTAGIAIGKSSLADEEHALAVGVNANATAKRATAVGDGAKATGGDSLAMGTNATASKLDAAALGRDAAASAQDATALGRDSIANKQGAMAFGRGAESSEVGAVALGQGAKAATNANDVALGAGSSTSDVVNTPSATVDKNDYIYAGTNATSTVSVGTKGNERTVTHVAAGRVSANSTDAINGSQLFGTNQAVDALGDDLDTAGQSVAKSLGGDSSYDPATHEVAASLDVNSKNYTDVESAIQYAAEGWDVSANGGSGENVAPGGSVDFSSDNNIDIAREGTNLTFGLADEIEVGTSITVGDTLIKGDSIDTNNMTVAGVTKLGDKFVVNSDNTVTYDGQEIANQADGLSFAGNTGGNIEKTLGEDAPLILSGELKKGEASTGANLRVDSDGDKLSLVMAKNLTDLDSISINNGGPVISDSGISMGGKKITSLAPGVLDDDAVNLGQLRQSENDLTTKGFGLADASGDEVKKNLGEAIKLTDPSGNITTTADNASGELRLGLNNDLSVGETGQDGVDGKVGVNGKDGSSVVINGEDGSIGLAGTNGADGLTLRGAEGAPGMAGTDGITRIVYEDDDGNKQEVATLNDGLKFDGNQGDTIAKQLNETLTVKGELANADDASGANLRVDSEDGNLSLVMAKNLTDLESITINNGGPVIDSDGINMGDNQITNVAAGTADDHAVNFGQLNQTVADNKVKYFSVNSTGGNNEDNDGATGSNSIAVGKNAVADEAGASAMGLGAKAQGVNGLSIGTNAKTSSAQAVAIGMDSDAAGTRATAVGAGAEASKSGSTAVGKSATASGTSSLALGDSATTTQDYSVAIGNNATIDGAQSGSMALGFNATVGEFSNALAMGAHAKANGQSAYAIGRKAEATGKGALAIGDESKAGTDAVALGTDASAQGQHGIAIGAGAKVYNSANGSLAIGKGAVASRRMSTVIGTAAGGDSTTGEGHTLIGYTAGGSMSGEDNTAVGRNSLTGADGKENAALGVNAGSGSMTGNYNAVVGGYAAQSSEGNQNAYMGHEAGRSAVGSDNVAMGKSANKKVAVSQSTALGSQTKVTSDGSVALGFKSVADGSTLSTAAYQPLDKDGNPIAVAASTASSEVSVGSAGNERRITNVAAGATDTDAVNVSQLKALGGSGLNFMGDDNVSVHRDLGQQLTVTGGADTNTLSDDNIGVVADGDNTLSLKLAQNIDLGSDGSVKTGNSMLNTNGLEVTDGTTTTTVGADNITSGNVVVDGSQDVVSGLSNTTYDPTKDYSSSNQAASEAQLGGLGDSLITKGLNFAGNDNSVIHKKLGERLNIVGGLDMSEAAASQNIRTVKNAAGDLEIQLAESPRFGAVSINTDGNDTINGLTNTTFDPNDFTSGQAASEDQLKQVSDVASKGWDLSAQDAGAQNVAPGGEVNLRNEDDNLTVTQATDNGREEVTFDLADDVTIGNSLTVTNTTQLGDKFTVNKDGSTHYDVTIDNSTGDKSLVNKEYVDKTGTDLTESGLNFAGNDYDDTDPSTVIHKDLGERLNIVGGMTDLTEDAASSANLRTIKNADGDLEIQMAKTLSDLDEVIVGQNGTPGKDGVNGEAGVGLDGKNGSIGITGKDGAGADITVANGKPGVDGLDGITRIVYEDGDGNEQEVATLKDGLKFDGNQGDTIAKQLNETLTVKGELDNADEASGANLRVDSADGNLNLVMARNLTELDSATFGESGTNDQFTINKDGVQFVDAAGDQRDNTPSIAVDGIDGGNHQITGVDSGLGGQNLGDVSGDDLNNVVNVGDLQGASSAEQGGGFGLADASGDEVKKDLGETITVTDPDGNITTTADNASGELQLGLSNDLGVGGDGKDGYIGVDGADGKTGVAINGKDGTIGLTGPAGNATIGIDGTNGRPGVDGLDGITRIVYEDGDGNEQEVATLKDGLKFDGNQGDTIAKQLNETLTVKGELANADDASGANLRVDSADGNLNLVMARNLTELDSATFGESGTNDQFTINKDGVQFVDAAGDQRDGTPSIAVDGIDGGNHQITSVGSGLVDGSGNTVNLVDAQGDTLTNAANISDLKSSSSDLVDKGLNFAGNTGKEIHKKLGATLSIEGGLADIEEASDSNIRVDEEGGKLNLVMAKNLTDVDSVTVGDTLVNNDGMTIAGGPSITKEGVDANNTIIKNVKAGEAGTDGVNVDQLDEVRSTANAGWNVATSNTTDTDTSNVAPEAVVDFVSSDGNVVIEHNRDSKGETSIDYALSNDVKVSGDLTVAGDTKLGDHFTVNEDGSTDYDVIIDDNTDGKSLVNKDYIDNVTNSGDFEVRYVHTNDNGLAKNDSFANGIGSTAVGYEAMSKGDKSLALGFKAKAEGDDSVALGSKAIVGEEELANLGEGLREAQNAKSITLDTLNEDAAEDTITYNFAGSSPVSTVSVGSVGKERTITNVGSGRISADSTDAVNGSQLYAAFDYMGDLNDRLSIVEAGDGYVKYDRDNDDNIDYGNVTMEGEDGTKITNVKDGEVSSESSDVINGSQLNDTNKNVSNNTTNIADNSTNISNNSSNISGNRSDIDQNTTNISNNRTDINQNTTDIADNRTDIDQNTTNISDNRTDIDQNTSSIADNRIDINNNTTNIADNRTDIDKGLNFGSDDGSSVNRQLGDTMAITGDDNITTRTGDDGVQVTLNRNLDVDSVTTGKTTVSNEGVTIEDGPSMTQEGVDAGGKVVTNVAAGRAPTDAANVGQLQDLNQRFSQELGGVHKRISNLEDDAFAGVASAIAASSVPQTTRVGKGMVAVGAGTYKGESAVAVGVSRLSENGRLAVKLNITGDSQGNFGAGVGAGWHW